jgi:hypothetical protein
VIGAAGFGAAGAGVCSAIGWASAGIEFGLAVVEPVVSTRDTSVFDVSNMTASTPNVTSDAPRTLGTDVLARIVLRGGGLSERRRSSPNSGGGQM